MKILHFADMHLGRGFSGYGEAGEELSRARYETLENLIGTANREECDAMVIAGDLFDRVSMAKKDVVRAIQILNRFEKGPVLLLPGNHDYYTADSKLWKYVDDAREDHVIVLKEAKPVSLKAYDLPAVIYPGPCRSKHCSENEIGWVAGEEKDTDKLNIGIAHGSVNGVAPDLNDEHFPMKKKELNDAGVDLWLLGHIHLPWPEKPGKNDRIIYCGTPEPDKATCTHNGTAFIVELGEDKQVNARLLCTGTYSFQQWQESAGSLEDLKKVVEKAEKKENRNIVCRLSITGKLEAEEYQAWNRELKPKIEKCFLHVRVDDTGLKKRITEDQIKREFTEDSFPDILLSLIIENQNEDVLETAYDLIQEVRHEN